MWRGLLGGGSQTNFTSSIKLTIKFFLSFYKYVREGEKNMSLNVGACTLPQTKKLFFKVGWVDIYVSREKNV